jgi:hypothetical protein
MQRRLRALAQLLNEEQTKLRKVEESDVGRRRASNTEPGSGTESESMYSTAEVNKFDNTDELREFIRDASTSEEEEGEGEDEEEEQEGGEAEGEDGVSSEISFYDGVEDNQGYSQLYSQDESALSSAKQTPSVHTRPLTVPLVVDAAPATLWVRGEQIHEVTLG